LPDHGNPRKFSHLYKYLQTRSPEKKRQQKKKSNVRKRKKKREWRGRKTKRKEKKRKVETQETYSKPREPKGIKDRLKRKWGK
jgi:hypothetical protein